MALSCAAEACDCEPWKEKHQEAQGALAEGRNFEAVQLVNASLEAYESLLKDADVQTGLLASDSSRFVQDARSKLSESQAVEIADIYTTRAEVLMALGGLGRALTELKSSLLLAPGNERATRLNEHCAELQAATKEAVKEWETDEAAKKVPVYMLTGFLGSGKTTLLNHILNDMHGKKLAVIENEFGEIGIDDALIATRQDLGKEHILEMNNGCICCTLRGDFIEGMQKVLKDVRARGSHLDAVFIETTGLADPSPIASTFFLDQFMRENYRLDSILGVCDTKHVLSQLTDLRADACVNEATEQVAFSDRLLLTKTDLCTEAELESVTQQLKRMNPYATLLPLNLRDTEKPLPVEDLCDVRAFSLDKALEFDSTFLDEQDDHVHDPFIKALGVKLQGSLNQDRLNGFFAEVLKRYPKEMYRMKGILDVKGIEERYIFHAVNCHFGGVPQGAWSSDTARESRAVFIGRGIDHVWIVDRLRLCFEAPATGVIESNVKSAHS
uniref:CobW C-terminal domain-containing protein n=1 Tax=Noctiluca scintillans TaxID=2966 RepID=A0A7S1AV84_NOCSC|mmetsp:Transcript_61767/g.164229  ORF Transcript_61767/g.164229 Transcript_61767/m.164229 type:complete len:499 (+) Transcript_61767:38-1534(+)